jgi:hypothetical protein
MNLAVTGRLESGCSVTAIITAILFLYDDLVLLLLRLSGSGFAQAQFTTRTGTTNGP